MAGRMKEFWLILRGALRAAAWKSAPVAQPATIRAVLTWIVIAMAAEAARQYFVIDDAAVFSIYGVNTLIAETAVLVAIGFLFFPVDRTTALAQLFALVTLAELGTFAACQQPVLTVTAGLVAVGTAYFSRHRTGVFSKLLALVVLAELVAFAAVRLLASEHPGVMAAMWAGIGAAVLFFVGLLVWWTGVITAIFRGHGGCYRRPLLRAVGLTAISTMALAAMPALPVFVGGDTDPSSYNLWEWARAKFGKVDSEQTAPRIDAAAVELAQPMLIEAQIRKLLPERKGTADVYAIGIAGWSDQDVFIKELSGGLAALDKSIGLDRGMVRLVNHADTTETLPIANRTNFASAVHSVAQIMDRDDDVLVLFITSHGGPTGVALRLTGALNSWLSPDHVAAVLDREGIKNRVLIVSACYSGVFAKRLASPDSVVLTAADANSASFGCSNEREWTYFGDAMFNRNLAAGVSLEDAFEKAKARISQWEARDDVAPSNPQGVFGSSLSEKLRAMHGSSDMHHALARER